MLFFKLSEIQICKNAIQIFTLQILTFLHQNILQQPPLAILTYALGAFFPLTLIPRPHFISSLT